MRKLRFCFWTKHYRDYCLRISEEIKNFYKIIQISVKTKLWEFMNKRPRFRRIPAQFRPLSLKSHNRSEITESSPPRVVHNSNHLSLRLVCSSLLSSSSSSSSFFTLKAPFSLLGLMQEGVRPVCR